MINEIKYNNVVLAKHITADEIKEGLSFFSNENDFVQVGTWNYGKDKVLAKHIHNVVDRKITRTQEVLYIIEGSIVSEIYTLDEEYIENVIAKKGDILILLNSGHGYTILEENTKVLEVKNGPYMGAEIDRRRF